MMDAICTRCSQTHSTAENIKYDEGGQGLRVERSSSRTQVRMPTTVLLTPSLTTSSSLMDGLLSCNQYVLLYSIYIYIFIYIVYIYPYTFTLHLPLFPFRLPTSNWRECSFPTGALPTAWLDAPSIDVCLPGCPKVYDG